MTGRRLQGLALALAFTLAGCGDLYDTSERRELILSELSNLVDPPERATIAEMRGFIPYALSHTDRPLILLEQPSLDQAEFFVQEAVNREVRVFGSDTQTTVALRGPVIIESRGFGWDLMSSDVGALPEMLRTGQGGDFERVMRYLDGQDHTYAYRFRCNLRRSDRRADAYLEYCGSAELEIVNEYVVDGSNKITEARQWIGPSNDYMVVRYLR